MTALHPLAILQRSLELRRAFFISTRKAKVVDMPTRKHIHAEELPAAPERVFALLHTPSAIRQWWSAARAIVLAQPGGMWIAS